MKYEYMDNTSIVDLFNFNEKQGILRDILLDIRVNNSFLFIGFEQDSRKRKNSIYILITKLRAEV